MSRTTISLGPPGTGKTTEGLRQVELALQAGTPPNKIAYLGFTRKAAHEAVARATAQFKFSRDEFPYFRTLHSLAFKELGLSPEQVMSTKHFEELGNLLGPYTFAGEYDEHADRGHPDGELGDKCLFIYSLHRSMLISLEQAWRLVQDSPTRFGPPDTQPLPFHVVSYFARGLDQYKRSHFLLDFTDFLDECESVLDVDLFILDEAQDLTPQQWRFARQLGRTAKKVLIAGDDDQNIYNWAGADVELLLRLNGERRVLPISYRLPRRVFDFLARLTSNIRRRIPKEFASRDADGDVRVRNGW
jgi:superfamily I DNA/RNA helicase